MRKQKSLCLFWLEMKPFGGLEISMGDKMIQKLISLTSLKTSKKQQLSKRSHRLRFPLSIHREILWYRRIVSKDSMNLWSFIRIIQLQHLASRQGYSLILNRITWIHRFNSIPMLRSRFHSRNTEREKKRVPVWKGYQKIYFLIFLN